MEGCLILVRCSDILSCSFDMTGYFFLQGGDPLEFKFGDAASLSVQSTSLPDKHPDHFVTR